MKWSAQSRRNVMKRAGQSVGTLIAFSTPATAGTASNSKRKRRTVVVPSEYNLEEEKKLAEDVPGYSIKRLPSGQYRVEYDTSKLPELSKDDRIEMRSERKKLREKALEKLHSKDNETSTIQKLSSSDRIVIDLDSSPITPDVSKIESTQVGDDNENGSRLLDSGGADARIERGRADVSAISAAGWGSWSGFAWVGIPITVKGSSSEDVNFWHQYYRKLTLASGGASSASASISLIVRNDDTGEIQDFTLYEGSASRIGADYDSGYYGGRAKIHLRPDEDYTIGIQTEAEITLRGIGLASARLGDQVPHNESPPPQVRWEYAFFR